ncbi:hypothetical protein EC9_27000 [Rosistilla ulvae]|uniref:Uncharacterized protein n=1 Tax=Rosistilla ulvae TaxID=1930277 RepID=A0A517M118_9BACT|nr:hypothetical protein EC9_27000 [Rosistilla ulvae]
MYSAPSPYCSGRGFIAVHAFGDDGGESRPLIANAYILFATMVIGLAVLSAA